MKRWPDLTVGVWIQWAVVWGVVGALALPLVSHAADSTADTLEDWAVADDHRLTVDVSGFALPTAIATVPEPGPAPEDPAYFVTELRGDIKAVTNDRQVIEIATVPTVQPAEDDLQGSSQSGLAGLCLAPEDGLVFATFAYPDEGGVLRNDVIRIDTGPTLSAEAVEQQRFSEVFTEFQSSAAHQIGGCHVDGDRLYIGVGDGGNAAVANDPDTLLGKVLCLDLEGGPCPDNPFVDRGGAAAHVLATGFRNPFGVQTVAGTVYVAENGIRVDRFLSVEPGADHLWDGSDASIATGADLVLRPSVAPVQLDHVDADHEVLGDTWGDHFVFSIFEDQPHTGVLGFAYDHEAARPRGVPRFLVQYVGDDPQHVIPVAVGPEGIHLAGAFPGPDGTSDILLLRPDDDAPHPTRIDLDWGQPTDERAQLLDAHSCVSCHDIGGGAATGGIAPSLDRFGLHWRVRERLNTPGYEERVHEMNAQAGPDEADRVEAREAVLDATEQERARVWVEEFLLDPRFDDPEVQMPDPGLDRDEARELAGVLVVDDSTTFLGTVIDFARDNDRAVLLGFLVGAGGTLFLAVALTALLWLRRRRSGRSDGSPAQSAADGAA